MAKMQNTVKQPITLTGKGLHTGIDVEITFNPAPVNHGCIFQRIDLEDKPLVHALAKNVTDTSRGTTLEENGVKVATIEHVMAALAGLELDNVLIGITGPEAPIMDGSSKVYVDTLKSTGILQQEEEKNYYNLKEKLVYEDKEKGVELVAYPDDHFSINVLIDYNSEVLGHQYATMESIADFEKEISPSRTFAFFHELEPLFKHNLIKGGDLQNAIVIMEKPVAQEDLDRLADLFNKPKVKVKSNGILNNIDLHFSNEPARHKLLDMVGDLFLIGQPINARIVAKRPGHFANTNFAKILTQHIKKESTKPTAPEYNPNKEPLMDINRIKKTLPHRPPFLLIDKIIEMTDTYVVGIKNTTMNEPFFVGHFPDEPVMPGVLQVEAMAQVGGILALSTVPDPENYSTYFLKIENVKFKKKVVPGDTLVIKMELLVPIRRGLVNMHGEAFVGDTLVTEGDLLAQIVKE